MVYIGVLVWWKDNCQYLLIYGFKENHKGIFTSSRSLE